MHRYLPHMQAEQQQAVACTRHIRASVEKKDLRKPEFPVPRKWLVGERSDNVIPAQMDGCSLYVFQCGNKIIWDLSKYLQREADCRGKFGWHKYIFTVQYESWYYKELSFEVWILDLTSLNFFAGNALARMQRVHAPTDLWDITFCTRRFWGF